MRRLQISDRDVIKMSIQQEILRSEESRYDHRLHGVLLICAGMSCYQVADLFCHSPRTIQSWVNRFEERGFAGLWDDERTGRPSVLNKSALHELEEDLRRSPRDLGYSQNMWDGKMLSHHLAKHFKAHLGVRQCQRLFHELGFRRRKPRGMIANGDPEKQKTYKKTPPSGSL
jgi:transposase